MKTSEIRSQFIRFFKERAHSAVSSDSLIPRDDPSLLFTGAGMNQFKDYFLGLKQDMKRAVSVQKCLRTGDLDNVGRTPYHHSFFEMLGNFSFGDYFKKEAIVWAWEFLTKVLKIPQARLSVSVYKEDTEASRIWQESVGLAPSRIARLDDRSNFWPAGVIQNGPNGPCGPCSEIYFDQGENVGCQKPACSLECSCGRFTEIWNLVFTQFDRKSDGTLLPLKAKNIDTGSGLERVACVLQGKKFNYEIDLFEPILNEIRERAVGYQEKGRSDLFALADHLRAITFTIGDGAYPSNEGRGYVVRKLIRRALWRARRLGISLPALSRLMPSVRTAMGDAYPELDEHEAYVVQVVKNEEERFLRTLDNGLSLIANAKKFNSADVFLLYDTYGFPVELTQQIALERNIPFEMEKFDELMEAQRQKAKKASKISADIFSVDVLRKEIAKRGLKPTVFIGYDSLKVLRAEVDLLIDAKGQPCVELRTGEEGLMVTRQTCFYAEGGGQVGDRGVLNLAGGVGLGDILDTFKKDELYFHRVRMEGGTLKTGDQVNLSVDEERRQHTMYNHTATHLLHAALRKVLGPHVRQLGSVVEPDRLRFDFSHFQAMSEKEKGEVERMVNEEIARSTAVDASVKSLEEAKQAGAIAFFGDKYGDRVRVISVGNFSRELCGGTHVKNTKEIGGFKITSESSVASGTRRIEAVTSSGIDEYLKKEKKRSEEKLKQAAEKKAKKINAAESGDQSLSAINCDTLLKSAKKINGMSVIAHFVDSQLDKKRLGALADTLKGGVGSGIVAVFSESEGRLQMIVTIGGEWKGSSPDANRLVKEFSKLVDGSGGGRPDFAQGGGKLPPDKNLFLSKVFKIIETAATK